MMTAILSLEFCVCLTAFPGMPSVQAVEDRFIENRTALKSGRLTMTAKIEWTSPKHDTQEWTQTLWFSPTRYRVDRITQKGGKTFRVVYCENCERDGYYVYYDQENGEPSSRTLPLLIQQMALPKGGSRVGSHLKFDPRILGVSTDLPSRMHTIKLPALVGRTDRTAPEMKKVRWQERDAFMISYKLKNSETEISQVFVPERSFCIVKTELNAVYKTTDETVHQILEVEPAQFGAAKIWFPSKLSLLYTINGKMAEKYLLEITDAAFNEPMPESAFKLAGMEIPEDTGINLMYPEAKGMRFWDGTKIAKKSRDGRELYRDLPPPTGSAIWTNRMFVASVALAVVAVLTFALYYWRRWANRSGG